MNGHRNPNYLVRREKVRLERIRHKIIHHTKYLYVNEFGVFIEWIKRYPNCDVCHTQNGLIKI
jgi:hypothetical protein